MKINLTTLGCPKNLVDSEKMLGTLAESGFALVPEQERADALVINTCGFLEASKQESLEVIRSALDRKRAGEVGRVIVAGGQLSDVDVPELIERADGISSRLLEEAHRHTGHDYTARP